MSELEFAAQVITDLEKENAALKRQLTLYRWAMIVIAVGCSFTINSCRGGLVKVKKSITVATLTLILGQSAGADCGQLWIDSQTFERDPKTPTAQYFKGVVSGWVAYDMMLNRPRIDWDNAAENSNADFANAVREYLDKVIDHADLTKYSAGECIHYAFHHFYGSNS